MPNKRLDSALERTKRKKTLANLPKKAQVAAADLAPEIVDEDEAGKEWAVTIPNLPPGVGHRFEAPLP